MIRKLLTITAVILPLFSSAAYSAAFIHIEGIPGSSQDPEHVGWLDVASLSAPSVTEARAARLLDSASPSIAEAVATGRVFPTVMIDQVLSEGTFRITMTNVLITSYNVQGSGQAEDIPVEDFTLSAESGTSGFVGEENKKGKKDKKEKKTPKSDRERKSPQ